MRDHDFFSILPTSDGYRLHLNKSFFSCIGKVDIYKAALHVIENRILK